MLQRGERGLTETCKHQHMMYTVKVLRGGRERVRVDYMRY